ncbi:type VI secretion system baseplate subunit TssF [Caballeronia sp. NK8]|uniref:type VI secretion system baseplate subunit TssF n=1 Tax=Caballeronia sp. NK8 TaxID=140098 RepID=UPI001BB549E6|nr:type VI secretion system baseplate subunit TssF [Caballeronia sp. NK8]BCQ26031.1 type VI secretion system baseplate subunit TssF [Caballeronia sp. NK8]
MDSSFVDGYNQELAYMRELAGEFAAQFPKIGRRLAMHVQGEVGDPYVERLLASFSFVGARMQRLINDAFPQLTEPLLEAIYPNYNAPTPAAAVARLFPGEKEGEPLGVFSVERGSVLMSQVPEGEKSRCTFVTTQDIALYPLEITSAELTGPPADIPSLERWLPDYIQVKGALRLKLRATRGTIASLRDLDRLPVYLMGDEAIVSRLFELLHVASMASVVSVPGQFGVSGAPFHAVRRNAVEHEAMEPGQGLLPLNWPKFHGHNLIHEFFAFQSRFWYFTLTQLAKGLNKIHGREAEIVVLLNQSPYELAGEVDVNRFALFCTPVINLFPLAIDSLELPTGGKKRTAQAVNEILVRPVPLAPLDYEVFRIDRLFGHVKLDSEKLEFMPRYAALIKDEGRHGRYFTTRRTARTQHSTTRRYGTRAPYSGTDLFAAFVDQDGLPHAERINYLSAEIRASNGDLPNLLECNGRDDLEPMADTPMASIGLVRAPSRPKPPHTKGEVAWCLIRQLNFGLSALGTVDESRSGEGLRDMLRLFVADDQPHLHRMIDAITLLSVDAITRKLPGNGDIVFGRGHAIRLVVDEGGFDGQSPYLFGLILDRYLARHVSMHSFVQVDLHTVQRGLIASFPVRKGTRGVA